MFAFWKHKLVCLLRKHDVNDNVIFICSWCCSLPSVTGDNSRLARAVLYLPGWHETGWLFLIAPIFPVFLVGFVPHSSFNAEILVCRARVAFLLLSFPSKAWDWRIRRMNLENRSEAFRSLWVYFHFCSAFLFVGVFHLLLEGKIPHNQSQPGQRKPLCFLRDVKQELESRQGCHFRLFLCVFVQGGDQLYEV